jgi:hypothetical protein
MTVTYEAIASQTLGSNVASISFTSIPSTYTDLVLIINTNNSSAAESTLRLNNDTATNYSRTVLSGTGSAAQSGRYTNQVGLGLSYNVFSPSTSNVFQSIRVDIMNYANTTTFKSVLFRANLASAGTEATVGLWRKTPEAINTITVLADSAPNTTPRFNFTTGSTFSLYGIKAE